MNKTTTQKKQQLEKDIKQLKKLILRTENNRVGQFLADKLSLIKAQLQLIQQQEVKHVKVKSTTTQLNSTQIITITKFAWQQIPTTNKIKIMIQMQDIKKQCQQSQIEPQYQPNSITLKISNYKGKNYIFSIPKLYAEIIPEKCSFYLTKNYLNIQIEKKYHGDWIDIHFKKDIFTPKKEEQKKQASYMNQHQQLLDMVKKMYEQGDPEYQRMIKEAFDKSQDKRNKNL